MSYFVCPNCSERHDIFGAGGGESLSRRFNTALLGQIPISVSVRESGDIGIPIVVGAPDSQQARVFVEVAEKVAAQVSIAAMKGGGLPIISIGD